MSCITVTVTEAHLNEALKWTPSSPRAYCSNCLLAQALKEHGSVSTNAYTARVDGNLYQVDAAGRALVFAFDRVDLTQLTRPGELTEIQAMLPRKVVLTPCRKYA